MNGKIKRGDMFYANLNEGIGSEQSGYRPILIVQNNTGNKHSHTVIVAVITSKIEGKTNLPTHYVIKAQQGLEQNSLIMLEQIRTLDKARLKEYIGRLDKKTMEDVDKALAISVGLRYIEL